ncbi:MAG: hypothetical protein IJ516_05485 [Phascolarctobacterium sp.]|nr:hypothetical protein [Phascolarctobacterium sp.]
MAKKKGKGKAITLKKTGQDFIELAETINNKRRHLVLAKEPHIAKIPKATLFVNGERIILNG